MLAREMRLLPPGVRLDTWAAWRRHAAAQGDRAVFPCLMDYKGDEPHVQRFVERQIEQHAPGLCDPRAEDTWRQAQEAACALVSAAESFCLVADYRCTAEQVAGMIRLCGRMPPQASVADLRESVCTPALVPVVVSEAGPPSSTDGLAALLCSRLTRAHVFQDLLPRFRRDAQHAELPDLVESIDAIRDDFHSALTAMHVLLFDDGPETVYTLALSLLAAGGEIDLDRLWADVTKRYEEVWASWREIVLPAVKGACYAAMDKRPLPAERHARATKAFHDATKMLQTLRRPSLDLARPSEAQLNWRRQPSTMHWWHITPMRCYVCSCSQTQGAFLACMLRALYRRCFARRE